MKFSLEFEYPIWSGESKVGGLMRMTEEAKKQIEERLNHPERFKDEEPKKRGWPLGKPRKPPTEAA